MLPRGGRVGKGAPGRRKSNVQGHGDVPQPTSLSGPAPRLCVPWHSSAFRLLSSAGPASPASRSSQRAGAWPSPSQGRLQSRQGCGCVARNGWLPRSLATRAGPLPLPPAPDTLPIFPRPPPSSAVTSALEPSDPPLHLCSPSCRLPEHTQTPYTVARERAYVKCPQTRGS